MSVKAVIEYSEYQEAVDDNLGWCKICEEFTRSYTEPYAENYDCEICETNNVFGAELAMIMEQFTILQ